MKNKALKVAHLAPHFCGTLFAILKFATKDISIAQICTLTHLFICGMMNHIEETIVPDQRFNEEGRKYQIQQLWQRQHEILGLALLGAESKEISELLSVTPATVSNCLNSEIGRQQLEIMRGARDADTIDLSKEIRTHAPAALAVLVRVLNDPAPVDEKNQIKVAMDLLDRSGYSAPKYVYGQFAHAHLSAADIDEIKERAHRRRAMSTEGCINVGPTGASPGNGGQDGRQDQE